MIDTLAVDGWTVTFGTYSEEGPEWAGTPPSPLLTVPNVTSHPSTVSQCTNFILSEQMDKGCVITPLHSPTGCTMVCCLCPAVVFILFFVEGQKPGTENSGT